MATHSSVLAWRIPGMGEPGGLLSMGLHRVRYDWSDLAALHISWSWLIMLSLIVIFIVVYSKISKQLRSYYLFWRMYSAVTWSLPPSPVLSNRNWKTSVGECQTVGGTLGINGLGGMAGTRLHRKLYTRIKRCVQREIIGQFFSQAFFFFWLQHVGS